MKKVLVAGATGYLGRFVVKELKEQGYYVRTLARDKKRLSDLQEYIDDERTGFITDPESLEGICEGIDYVFSSVGITRQKDGLTYQDVDFQGNMNLLHEAEKENVKKFMYVSVFNGEQLKNVQICMAKEQFSEELRRSGLSYVIIRPNGFFSDMGDFLKMAKGGKVYLFGNGELKMNPIHGRDLARFCAASFDSNNPEPEVGGPEIFTHNEIAVLALKAAQKKGKIVHLPDWTRRLTLSLMKTFTSPKTYGPFEFFLSAMALDMEAPVYGEYCLEDYFLENAGIS